MAYGLMYYLLLGAPHEPNKPFVKIIPKYLEELERNAGHPHAAALATKAAFESVDISKLAAAFADFWKTSRKRTDAYRLQNIK
jgi:hypothetical protein